MASFGLKMDLDLDWTEVCWVVVCSDCWNLEGSARLWDLNDCFVVTVFVKLGL